MEHEMRELINKFKDFLKENSEEKLNISDVRSSKIIYTVIPYFSNGYEVNQNDVKSFTDFKKAEEYTWTLNYHFDVIENELI
jgi:hypothetical protein